MLLQGQENLLRELKWLEKEKRLNETTFSGAKREYVSAVKWIVNEIKFQYAMLNILLNGINVYSIV